VTARAAVIAVACAGAALGACGAPRQVEVLRAWHAAGHGRAFVVARFERAGAPRWLVAGGEPQVTGRVALFGDDGRPVAARELADDVAYAVAVAPGGALAAVALADGRVVRLALPDLEPALLWQHGKPAVAVAFAPDGRTLASGGLDGVVRIGDVETPAAAAPPLLALDHGAPVTCVAWPEDGSRVLGGTRDGVVRLHERAGRLVRSWQRLGGEITAVGWRAGSPWCRVRESPIAAERELALELP
jgi:hypothetical protein